MKKYLFSTLMALACVFSVQSVSADPICDYACNRYSCQVKELQDMCKANCSAGSVKNCAAATSFLAAEAAGNIKGQFCDKGCNRYSCKSPQVKGLCDKVCDDKSSIKNCLAA